jgi:DNA-binding PadR family transcriptional regulator
MSLSPTKYEILETMLLLDKPERATSIAKETGKEFPSVMMHIIGLTRMGYTSSPEKGVYTITEKGKAALGIPEINGENAKTILASMPQEKAFYFYAGLGKPLSLHAQSLQDFRDKILQADLDAIEFHKSRGDFEAWFKGIGDAELAKKTALLKEKNMSSEELRKRLHDIVAKRCMVLASLAEQMITPEPPASGA